MDGGTRQRLGYSPVEMKQHSVAGEARAGSASLTPFPVAHLVNIKDTQNAITMSASTQQGTARRV